MLVMELSRHVSMTRTAKVQPYHMFTREIQGLEENTAIESWQGRLHSWLTVLLTA